MWTPLQPLLVGTKQKLLCRCACGVEKAVRVRELLDGKSSSCRSCAMRLRAAGTPVAQRVALAKHASTIAAAALGVRVANDPYLRKYGSAFVYMRRLASSAKQRCTNPNCIAYSNYGGRGVTFGFPTTRAFAEWVLDNLGERPSPEHSLDRIDNNQGYCPGNLRWATHAEQARNKRQYRRTKSGERIRALHAQRPDITYESLRTWVHQGASDEEILQRRKYARPSV